MNTISLEVSFPSDLLSLLRFSQHEMTQAVQRWVALELFRTRKISAGKAAEVAGVSLAEFMDITLKHDVAWVDYTDDELAVELQEAMVLGEAINNGEV